jgi:hypothetical protein
VYVLMTLAASTWVTAASTTEPGSPARAPLPSQGTGAKTPWNVWRGGRAEAGEGGTRVRVGAFQVISFLVFSLLRSMCCPCSSCSVPCSGAAQRMIRLQHW